MRDSKIGGRKKLGLMGLCLARGQKTAYVTGGRSWPNSYGPRPFLRSGFGGVDGGGGGVDFETEEPVAGDVATVEFCWGEFPELGGFKRAVGEIWAGAGSGERGFGYGAGFVDVNFDADANFAADCVSGFLRGVGQDLLKDFGAHDAACGCCRWRHGSGWGWERSSCARCRFVLAGIFGGTRGIRRGLRQCLRDGRRHRLLR